MKKMNMECEEAERMILMYRDLNADERIKLEKHMAGCSSCTGKMALQKAFDMTVQSAAHVPLVPVDAERLTMKVMAGLETRTKSKTSWNKSGIVTWMKYAMASLSLVLIVTFYTEYSEPDAQQVPGASETLQATLQPRGKKVLQESPDHKRSMSLYALIKN